jgi:hypothetical protein
MSAWIRTDYQQVSNVQLVQIFEKLVASDKDLFDRRPNIERVRSELLHRLSKVSISEDDNE